MKKIFSGMLWILSILILVRALPATRADLKFNHLSSSHGELPVPGTSLLQTALLVGDFDGDDTNDVIFGFGDKAPALTLFHGGSNWMSLPIELGFIKILPGGTTMDIDRDGDLDLVFTTETEEAAVCWWENPFPTFDPNKSWKRRIIHAPNGEGGGTPLFGNFLQTGHHQLVWWNGTLNQMMMALMPGERRSTNQWETVNFTNSLPFRTQPPGLVHTMGTDLNIDGHADLIAGNIWFKYVEGTLFKPVKIGRSNGRVAVGRFKEGTYPQVIIAPINTSGPVIWHTAVTHIDQSRSWAGRPLLDHDVNPIGALAIGDLDRDGDDDILLGELAHSTGGSTPDNPQARAWIIQSDGAANFTPNLLSEGIEFHETRLIDIDADGDLDIVNAPLTWQAPRWDIWVNESTPPPRPIEPRIP